MSRFGFAVLVLLLAVGGAFVPVAAHADAPVPVYPTGTWQRIGEVRAGEHYSITAAGAWTADNRQLDMWTLPNGYSSLVDGRLKPNCKVDTAYPYGALLTRIGNGPIVATGTSGPPMRADQDGAVYATINGNAQCLGPSSMGAYTVQLRTQ